MTFDYYQRKRQYAGLALRFTRNVRWRTRLRSIVARLLSKAYGRPFDIRMTLDVNKSENVLGHSIVLLSSKDAKIRDMTAAYVLGATVILFNMRFRDKEHFEETRMALWLVGYSCTWHGVAKPGSQVETLQ